MHNFHQIPLFFYDNRRVLILLSALFGPPILLALYLFILFIMRLSAHTKTCSQEDSQTPPLEIDDDVFIENKIVILANLLQGLANMEAKKVTTAPQHPPLPRSRKERYFGESKSESLRELGLRDHALRERGIRVRRSASMARSDARKSESATELTAIPSEEVVPQERQSSELLRYSRFGSAHRRVASE